MRKFDGWTRRMSAVALADRRRRSRRRASCSSCRLRAAPRPTAPSRPARGSRRRFRRARRATRSPRGPRRAPPGSSSVAAALLFTTTAASAPVRRQSSASACTSRRPRLPRPRSYSSVEYPRATAAIRSIADSASGARPRFVWMMTPVALMTGSSDGRNCPRRDAPGDGLDSQDRRYGSVSSDAVAAVRSRRARRVAAWRSGIDGGVAAEAVLRARGSSLAVGAGRSTGSR